MPATLIPTRRPLHQRLWALAREHRLWVLAREHFSPAGASLGDLDRRALADIGVDPSEIASIEAESFGRARVTRRRIVAGFYRPA